MGVENEVESYLKGFAEFDSYVNIINSQNSIYDGYIINLISFQNLKDFLNNYKAENKSTRNLNEENLKLKPEASGKDFMNQINNNYQFIIINLNLCRKICIHNDHNIKYKISSEKITLYTENGLKIKFKNNKDNIISKKSLLIAPKVIYNNKKKLDKVCNDLINYYENGKKVEEILNDKNNKGEEYKGLLVDMDWIDKWKKYSNYDFIKSKYLLKHYYDINEIKNTIKKNQENLDINNDEVNNIEEFIVKDIKRLNIEENVYKPFKILNLKFIKSFNLNSNIIPTTFFLSYNTIKIMNQGQPFLTFETKKNVIYINSKSDNTIGITSITLTSSKKKDKNIYLKHLIRNYYLYKEFISKSKILTNEFTQAFLIKDEIFAFLNNNFNFNYIITCIEKNSKLNDITYQNFAQNFPLILKYIKENHSDYFEYIKQYDNPGTIKFTKDEGIFTPEYLNNQHNLKYIDDFRIIDKEFAFFLTKKFGDIINIPEVYFAIKENLFFLIINPGKNNIYEFANLNSNYSFKVKYLMELTNFQTDNIKLLNNTLLNFFLNNEIDKIISSGNPIIIEDYKIIFNIYAIKNSLGYNMKNKKTKSYEIDLNIKERNTDKNEIESNTYIQTNPYNQNFELNTVDQSPKNSENKMKNSYSQISSSNYKIKDDIPEPSYQHGYLIDKNIYKSILDKINSEKMDNNCYKDDLLMGSGSNNINIQKANIIQIKFESIIKDNNQSLIYPIDFDIIDQKKLNHIQNLMKEYISKISIEEIDLVEVNQYCILIPKNNNFLNENYNLIYLYSIKEKKINKSKSYEPFALLECNCENINERNKLFQSIFQIKDLGFFQNPKLLEEKLKCICHLIENNNQDQNMVVNPSPKFESKNNDIQIPQNNEQHEENEEKYLEKYLKFAMKLIKERDKIIKNMNQQNEYNDKSKLNYYLIHKNYINKLYEIFDIKSIESLMNQYKTMDDKEMLNIIKINLPENIKMKINSLNENDIQNEFSSKEIYCINPEILNNNHINRLLYYKDCDIISNEILNQLEKIDKNIKHRKTIEINCVFDSNKIIVYKKGYIINIDNYQNGNLLVEYIIFSQNLDFLFNEFI